MGFPCRFESDFPHHVKNRLQYRILRPFFFDKGLISDNQKKGFALITLKRKTLDSKDGEMFSFLECGFD